MNSARWKEMRTHGPTARSVSSALDNKEWATETAADAVNPSSSVSERISAMWWSALAVKRRDEPRPVPSTPGSAKREMRLSTHLASAPATCCARSM